MLRSERRTEAVGALKRVSDTYDIPWGTLFSATSVAALFGYFSGRLWRHKVCNGRFCSCSCTFD